MLLALITLILLLLSWWAPLFTITQLWLFDDQVSMISVVSTLFDSGNFLVLLLIASASMLLPLFKALLILRQAMPTGGYLSAARSSKLIGLLSRWAMLDIWVVALLVVVIKLSAWADATIQWGLYLHLVVVALLWWQSRDAH